MDEHKLVEEIKDADILISSTSSGMKTTIDKAIMSSPAQLSKNIFVAGIIYDSNQTKPLKIAEEASVKNMNGLMMIWKGAIAYNIWTGQDMAVEIIKKEIFV